MGEPIVIYHSPSKNWLVICDSISKDFDPLLLFRVIHVRPVEDILDVVEIVKPLGKFLQTTGIAIPNNRLVPFANGIGEVGVTNIRTISSKTLQKAWEPWDGRFPLQELLKHNNIRWVSINTRNIHEKIKHLLEQ